MHGHGHRTGTCRAPICESTSLLVVAVDPAARVVAGLIVRDHGALIIGRYERCAFMTESGRISRVHLLLVRIDGDLWAIDTASTHGVRRGRVKIEAEVLSDVDAFSLARELVIGWERTKHPEA